MLEVLRYIAYIALNACVKYYTEDQSNVKCVKGTLYGSQCIKCYVMLCMLKTSKMVFAAFMQHCKQSTDLMSKVSKILWIQWPLAPPGRKACTAFHLVDLVVHHQSVQGGSFLTFFDLSTTRVIAGKMHSQSPILKLNKGVLSNPVILTYLWEQSCILHTLTRLPT